MSGRNFCVLAEKISTQKSEDGGTNWTSSEKNKKEGKALQEKYLTTQNQMRSVLIKNFAVFAIPS